MRNALFAAVALPLLSLCGCPPSSLLSSITACPVVPEPAKKSRTLIVFFLFTSFKIYSINELGLA